MGQREKNRDLARISEEFQEQDRESGEPWSERSQWVGESQRRHGDWGALAMQETQCPASRLWLQCHESAHLPPCPCGWEGMVRVTTELVLRILVWVLCIVLWKAAHCSGSSVLWFTWWHNPPKSSVCVTAYGVLQWGKCKGSLAVLKRPLLFLCTCGIYANIHTEV